MLKTSSILATLRNLVIQAILFQTYASQRGFGNYSRFSDIPFHCSYHYGCQTQTGILVLTYFHLQKISHFPLQISHFHLQTVVYC